MKNFNFIPSFSIGDVVRVDSLNNVFILSGVIKDFENHRIYYRTRSGAVVNEDMISGVICSAGDIIKRGGKELKVVGLIRDSKSGFVYLRTVQKLESGDFGKRVIKIKVSFPYM